MADSPYYTHDGEREDYICPRCGEQGFDYRGKATVRGTAMTLLGCWGCGIEFATEDR